MDSKSKRETCSFYLKKKKRFCALERAPGSPFCHLHSAELDVRNGAVSDRERVPCPIDPTHTVPIRKLKTHVERKCPALKLRPDRKLPYVRDDVETLSEKKESSETLPLSSLLHHFDDSFLKSFRKRIEDVVEEIGSKWMQGGALELTGTTRMFEDGSGKSKHQPQLEGILRALSTRLADNVDRDHIPVIEMGCGRAELSQYLAEVGGFKNFVLIDRKTCAHPRDKHIRMVSEDTKVVRHKIDLRHIVISGLPSIIAHQTEERHEVPYIACSKHLCGNATDLALTAICGSICCAIPCGIVIALCCHHRVTFDDYVGHEFLKKMEISSDPDSFSLLVKLTGWAVCAVTDTPKGAERLGFSSAEDSIRFGWKCKRVLDLGRLFFLQEIFPCTWDIGLCPYVPESISLENLLLVAFPKKGV